MNKYNTNKNEDYEDEEYEDYLSGVIEDIKEYKIDTDYSNISDRMLYAPYKKIDVNNRFIDDESFRELFDVYLDDNPKDHTVLENVFNTDDSSSRVRLKTAELYFGDIHGDNIIEYKLCLQGAVKKILIKNLPRGKYALMLNDEVVIRIKNDIEEDFSDLTIDFSLDESNTMQSILPNFASFKKVFNQDLVEKCQKSCLNFDFIQNVRLLTKARTICSAHTYKMIMHKMMIHRYFLEENQLVEIKTETILNINNILRFPNVENLYAIDLWAKKDAMIKIIIDNHVLGSYDVGTGHTRIRIRDSKHVFDNHQNNNSDLDRFYFNKLQRTETLQTTNIKDFYLLIENYEEIDISSDISIQILWLDLLYRI